MSNYGQVLFSQGPELVYQLKLAEGTSGHSCHLFNQQQIYVQEYSQTVHMILQNKYILHSASMYCHSPELNSVLPTVSSFILNFFTLIQSLTSSKLQSSSSTVPLDQMVS